MSLDACRTTSNSDDLEVLLEDETIKQLFSLTTRYVYGLKGLNVIDQYGGNTDFAWKLPHPCTPNMRSRWLLKNLTDCDPTNLFSGTNASLSELIHESDDTNPYLRDIYFPEVGMSCNETDTIPDIEIEVGGSCWERVHDDYMSIYDMTYWVDRHPGGSYHIMKWAENNETFLVFPNGHPVNNHPMYRWHDNYHKFSYVGRYGDSIRIKDLPNDLRSQEVTSYYEDAANVSSSGVLVCGSPGEVANNASLEFAFDVANDFQTGPWGADENKKNVWVMASLEAPDQLRQRVAWALTQVRDVGFEYLYSLCIIKHLLTIPLLSEKILVVVKDAIGTGYGRSEWFLAYYDIFVRNAFGNYRDVSSGFI